MSESGWRVLVCNLGLWNDGEGVVVGCLMGGPLDTSDRRYLQEYLSIIPGGLNIDLDNYSTGWEPPRIISGILT